MDNILEKTLARTRRKLGLASYYEAVALLRRSRRKTRTALIRKRRRRPSRELAAVAGELAQTVEPTLPIQPQ